jgi:hypothetical protein
MTREEYVKNLIHERSTVKEFAKSIGLPYTTLLGMLKNGLGGAAVDNVIKVCRGLEITVDDLQQVEECKAPVVPFFVSEREKRIVTNYRAMPHMQAAVDAILNIEAADKHK